MLTAIAVAFLVLAVTLLVTNARWRDGSRSLGDGGTDVHVAGDASSDSDGGGGDGGGDGGGRGE
jgi:hypothetical protein